MKKRASSPRSEIAADRRRSIIAVVLALGEGEVVSYGDVADSAGIPGRARFVGRVLAESSDDSGLPWWRVVTSDGRLVPGLEVEQASLLSAQGVRTDGSKVRGSPRGRFAGR